MACPTLRPLAWLVALSISAAVAARAEDAGSDPATRLAAISPAVRAALKAKDPGRALDLLRPCTEVEALDLVADALSLARTQRVAAEKSQAGLEAKYEALIDEGQAIQREYEMTQQTSRDLDNFNRKARKVDGARQATLAQLRNFETEFARLRGVEQQAAGVAAEILGRLDESAMAAGIARLEAEWLASKEVEARLRFIHAIWSLPAPEVAVRLHTLLDAPDQPLAVRATAMAALTERGDERLLTRAIDLLGLPPEQFAMTTAALRTLRKLHRPEAIEPLIAFLGREDIAALREDATLALRSLTGEKHGPYAQPWATWWEDAKRSFTMPKDPIEPGRTEGQKSGVTFYDIHTFSDRVLFIVDISGSMDQVDGDPQGRTKWDLARAQLMGAVHGLDPNAVFNVIFFNHGVVSWQRKVQPATESIKNQLTKWVDDTTPIGGTNLHDSLEMGFGFATAQATGRPIIDTVFYLTDGRPTAGKIQDPKAILARVREWNAVAHLRIHAVGIGKEHDVEFMQELARIGDGQYVAR